MIKIQNTKIIELEDWNELVTSTYGRVYNFQQQDACKSRGIEYITVPVEEPFDYSNDTVQEEVNGCDMGVSFKAWLDRDPTKLLSNLEHQEHWSLNMWWDRNFYPNVDMIINDLHSKGLLEAGEYGIKIDW